MNVEIVVKNLWKSFAEEKKSEKKNFSRLLPIRKNEKFWAVKGISFQVEKKDFFGLLGSNGAGKSVTLSCMSGLLVPDQGEILVQGNDIVKHPELFKEKMNIVLGSRLLYSKLSICDNLEFYAKMYGLNNEAQKKKVKELMDLMNLNDCGKKKFEDLSTGQKQRACIARALINDPEVLLLDEPTVGVDAVQQKQLHELFKELNKTKTIVLTSHYLHEVESLCNRVVIMKSGEIVANDSPKNLIKQLGKKSRVTMMIESKVSELELRKFLPMDALVKGSKIDVLTIEPEEVVQKFISQTNGNVDIKALEISKPSLEDVFIALTGEQLEVT